jgi:hypothetical protein
MMESLFKEKRMTLIINQNEGKDWWGIKGEGGKVFGGEN